MTRVVQMVAILVCRFLSIQRDDLVILAPRSHPLFLMLGCLFSLLAWAAAGDDPDDPGVQPGPRCHVYLTDNPAEPLCTITYTVEVDGTKVIFAERKRVEVPEHQHGNAGIRWQITQAMRRDAEADHKRIAWTVEHAERLAREYAALRFSRIAIEAVDPEERDAQVEVAQQ